MDEINKFLSDVERVKIEMFNQDPVLVNAIRKVLLATIYNNGVLKKDVPPDPLRNGALNLAFMTLKGDAIVSNEELGADLRGLAQGINLLEKGLLQLQKITSKKPGEPAPDKNPGV